MKTLTRPTYSHLLRNNPFSRRYSSEELSFLFESATSIKASEGDYVKYLYFRGIGQVPFVARQQLIERVKTQLAENQGYYYQGITRDAIKCLEQSFKLLVEAYLDSIQGDLDVRPGFTTCNSVIRRV